MKTGVMRFQCTLLLIQISSAEAELDIQHSHIEQKTSPVVDVKGSKDFRVVYLTYLEHP